MRRLFASTLAALALTAALPPEAFAERRAPRAVSSWRNDGVSTAPKGTPAVTETAQKKSKPVKDKKR